MTPVRVAVVGAGVMGARHVDALSGLPSADLVGVADRNADQSVWPGVPVFDRLEDLLALQPDAVVVATPAASHRQVVERCFALGAHVLVEKPFATTIADADALISAAERAGRRLVVGHVERFSPVMRDVRARLAGEAVISISTMRVGSEPTHVRDVGALLDLAVHDIDLVRWLTGGDYVHVEVDVLSRAPDGRETHARLRAVLDDGTRVSHEVSWLAARPTRRWSVVAERGNVDSIDLLSPHAVALAAQDEAFLADCVGEPGTGWLADAADGAAAVRIALGEADSVRSRARAGWLPSQGAAAVFVSAAPDGRSVEPA